MLSRSVPGRGQARFLRVRVASLAPLALVAACAGGDEAARETHTIVDSAGVRIVESHLPARGDSARIDPDPQLRIGREEAGPYQFSAVPFGLLFDDGTLAVVAQRAGEVRIFDSAGEHVRSFGRPGEGPGEFGVIGGLFRYRTDSIAVYDARHYRTTFLSTDSFDSHRTISNEVPGNYSMFGGLRNGPFLLFDPGGGFHPELDPGLQWTSTDVVAVDPADGSSRAIARLPSREQFVEPNGDTRMMVPRRFAIRAAGADGFYWATPDRYEIGFYDVEGTLRGSLRRPVEPRAVTPDMVEEYVDSQVEAARSWMPEAGLADYRRQFDDAHVGERVPLFGEAFVDADDRLWVSGPAFPAGRSSRWSLFSADGVWLGDVEAPERVTILDARGDRVLGVRLDELDIPHVQLHRIVR